MRIITFVVLSMITWHTVFSQERLKITSRNISKTVPVLVQTPDDYQHSRTYPIVFMLHGYSENFEQWIQTADLRKLATNYQMILICPEGFVSYYINSPILQNFQYEDFFFEELVPEIREKYSVDDKNIFITGLSMGGYGALRLFIKYPAFFNTATSTSGALEFDYDNFKRISRLFFGSDRMTDDLEKSLGDPKLNDWGKQSISTLLYEDRNFNKGFLLDCGLQDPLLENTLKIKEFALSEKLPISFILKPGEHNAEYWAKSIEYHFVYFKQHLK